MIDGLSQFLNILLAHCISSETCISAATCEDSLRKLDKIANDIKYSDEWDLESDVKDDYLERIEECKQIVQDDLERFREQEAQFTEQNSEEDPEE